MAGAHLQCRAYRKIELVDTGRPAVRSEAGARIQHSSRMPRPYSRSGDEGAMRQYDVCLSFAGEDRDYVKRVAEELHRRQVRVFYDQFEISHLWGKNLYTH